MAAKKKNEGPDKYKRCDRCDATEYVCSGFYKRDKGLPACCSECSHGEGVGA